MGIVVVIEVRALPRRGDWVSGSGAARFIITRCDFVLCPSKSTFLNSV